MPCPHSATPAAHAADLSAEAERRGYNAAPVAAPPWLAAACWRVRLCQGASPVANSRRRVKLIPSSTRYQHCRRDASSVATGIDRPCTGGSVAGRDRPRTDANRPLRWIHQILMYRSLACRRAVVFTLCAGLLPEVFRGQTTHFTRPQVSTLGRRCGQRSPLEHPDSCHANL